MDLTTHICLIVDSFVMSRPRHFNQNFASHFTTCGSSNTSFDFDFTHSDEDLFMTDRCDDGLHDHVES